MLLLIWVLSHVQPFWMPCQIPSTIALPTVANAVLVLVTRLEAHDRIVEIMLDAHERSLETMLDAQVDIELRTVLRAEIAYCGNALQNWIVREANPLNTFAAVGPSVIITPIRTPIAATRAITGSETAVNPPTNVLKTPIAAVFIAANMVVNPPAPSNTLRLIRTGASLAKSANAATTPTIAVCAQSGSLSKVSAKPLIVSSSFSRNPTI